MKERTMNTRNRYYSVAALALGMLACASCDDFLDEMPDNRATVDSEEKVSYLLVSAYPTATYAYMTEMYSDNVDKEANPTYTTYQLLEDEAALWKDITFYDESDDSPYAVWNAHYMAIASANQALQAIEELGNPASLQGEKGEALMCRAYSHWVLVNVFCKNYGATSSTDLGVPYVTAPETSLESNSDRGTVAEVYEKIDKDIQEALPLMDDSHIKVPKYHFTKKAAYAFASRFYLFYTQPDLSNYDKVIKYADEVLTANPATMLRDWQTVGAKAINGGVRAMAYTDASDNANLLIFSTYSLWARVYGPYGVAYKYCHGQLIANNETCASNPWGSKSALYFRIPQYQGMPKVIMAKMAEYFEYTDPVNGIGHAHVMYPALTSDEVLLNRAEAYILKGDLDKGADDLNLWGTRFYSGATEKSVEQIASYYENMDFYTPENPTPKKAIHPDFAVAEGNQTNMIYAVLAARRILQLHEGNRWFDVKRYGIEISRRSILNNKVQEVIDTMGKDDPRRAIQLPQTVITAGVAANPR